MGYSPTLEEFVSTAQSGTPQLMWKRLSVDTETPVSAMLKLLPLSPYHLLFESVEGGQNRARYSIIALDPDMMWRVVDGVPQVNRQAAEAPEQFDAQEGDVFTALRAVLAESQLDIPSELPPMATGLFGYMAYDMVKYMERLPDENPAVIGVPQAWYMRPRITVIFDSVKDEALIITPVWADALQDAEAAYTQAQERIARIVEALRAPTPVLEANAGEVGPFTAALDEAAYAAVVEQAKEYIRAGDVFQVVPSRRIEGAFSLPPFALYRALRQLNPSPYLFYLSCGEGVLVGSSPEILVRVHEGVVTIRPIAGTRPRGKDAAEDKALEADLLSDEKELAEHLMLLDLGRNDVGRVAEPASVCVTEQMVIERYSHVMHIVSNVEGDMRVECDAVDALIAGFPAGTVSGAPKIRAMEIIDELEPVKREFYAGTVGYFSAGGDMDTCIALRTGLVKDGVLYLQAGGGIVADSVPHNEFVETENKAGALMSAAQKAKEFIG